jgi:nucleotide-binding universal stress UspA family protein
LDLAYQETVSLIAVKVNKKSNGRSQRSLEKVLLRASPIPVAILPGDLDESGSGEKGFFTRVIFATDWSTSSEKALSYLAKLKKVIRALEIVHVIEKRLSIRDMRDIKDKIAKTRKTLLDDGKYAEPHIYAGKKHEEILLAAKDYDATCIVMGINRNSLMQEILNRSTAYRVAGSTMAPLLVIP